jgi:mxaJ protein
MFFRSLRTAVSITALLLWTGSARCGELRVCADPHNLPFSNTEEQGFENKIAKLLAEDLHAQLRYQWQRMGRGFVREYVDKGLCDVLIGVPYRFRPMLTTTPYYRSTYVFVVRTDARIKPRSLDDPRLRELRVAVQVLDEQYAPPAEALARRGLQKSLVPFYGVAENAELIVNAVAERKVDAAVVWGPLAGYMARQNGRELEIIPLKPEMDPPGLPFTFEISMGVRKGNDSLKDKLEQFVRHRAGEIRAILADYGVPQLEMQSTVKEAD